MYCFTSPQEIPVPLVDIDYQILASLPRRFKNGEHFQRVLHGILESLETSADPVLHWGAGDANIAFHILIIASSEGAKPTPIQTDTVFRDGKELIGTPKHKLSAWQKYLREKAEILQVIRHKSS